MNSVIIVWKQLFVKKVDRSTILKIPGRHQVSDWAHLELFSTLLVRLQGTLVLEIHKKSVGQTLVKKDRLPRAVSLF